jgi:hypothetical protein
MCAADDETLRKFLQLCHHWHQLASAELALRTRTKASHPMSDTKRGSRT